MSRTALLAYVAFLFVVVSILAPSSPSRADSYTITDVGPLGATSISVVGMNDNGQIMGQWSTPSVTDNFLWTAPADFGP